MPVPNPDNLPAAPAYGRKADGTMYRILGVPGPQGPIGPEGPPGTGDVPGTVRIGAIIDGSEPVPDPADPWPTGQLWINDTYTPVRTQIITYAWSGTTADMSPGSTWTTPPGYASCQYTSPCPGILVVSGITTMYIKATGYEYIAAIVATVKSGVTQVSSGNWGRTNAAVGTYQHANMGWVGSFAADGSSATFAPQVYCTSASGIVAFKDFYMHGIFYPYAAYKALSGAT